MKKTAFLVLWILLTGLSFLPARAQRSPVFAPDGVAIRGYDPVAYFTEHKPVLGKAAISYSYQGTTWHFASVANRKLFQENPEKYAPQYGGYCAYGTARGYKAPTEPDAWTILNGKLYLNYNQKVQATWNKDQAGYIEKANTNWLKIKDVDSH